MCPNCKAPLQMPSVQTQLEMQVRKHVARLYEGWTMCQDATCGQRTRMMGVYGKRCLRPGCTGQVVMEVRVVMNHEIAMVLKSPQYSDLALYTQLAYFRSLFDGDKAVSKAKGARQGGWCRGASSWAWVLTAPCRGTARVGKPEPGNTASAAGQCRSVLGHVRPPVGGHGGNVLVHEDMKAAFHLFVCV